MTWASTLLFAGGLFLGGGTFSFIQQKMPRGVTLLLALGALMCVLAGVARAGGVGVTAPSVVSSTTASATSARPSAP